MDFIYMIYNNFLRSNLLIAGLFNSFDKSFIVKFPMPSFCLVLIIYFIANVPKGRSLYGILSISLTIILSQSFLFFPTE